MDDARRSEELLAHTEWLGRLARALLGDASEAADAVQDTLVVALEHEAQRVASPRAWLASVLRNTLRKRARSAERRRRHELLSRPEEPAAAPDELVERALLQQELLQAVLALEEPDRGTLLRHYFDGESAVAIGAREGCSAAVVRQRLKRARDRLRARLQARRAGSERGWRHALLVLARSVERPVAAPRTNFVVAGISAALIVGALSLWLRAQHATPAAQPTPTVGAASRAQTAPDATGVDPGVEAQPQTQASVRSGSRAASGSGAVSVHVRWADDARDAAGMIVRLRSTRPDVAFPLDRAQTTDAHGNARFDGLARCEARVGLLQGGDEYQWIAVGEHETRTELVQPVGITVTGVVVDEHEAPLPGAEIWLSEGWQSIYGQIVTTADARGRFRVRGVQTNGSNWIGARSKGRAPCAVQAFDEVPEGETVDVHLVLDRPGARVEIEVVDTQQAPIPGAELLVGEESDEHARAQNGGPPWLLVTDDRGLARADGVALGRNALRVRSLAHGFARASLDVLAQGENRLRLVLPDAASVSGRAFARDGRTLANATIHAFEANGFLSASTRTDERGQFRLGSLGTGAIPLTAAAPDGLRAQTEVVLTSGEGRTWDAHLAPAARIFGTLLDEHGKAAARQELLLFTGASAEWSERHDLHWTQTDEHGAFAVEDLSDGPWTLVAGTESFGFPPLVVRALRPGLEGLRLQFPDPSALATFAVRATDARGEPDTSAWLHVLDLDQDHGEDLHAAEGAASIDARLPAGRYAFELRSQLHVWKTLGEQTLAARAQLDLGAVQLADGARVRGTIRGCESAACAALELAWSDPDGRRLGTTRASGDRYESPLLAGGEHVLVVQGPGIARCEQRVSVAAGRDGELDLTLENGRPFVLELTRAPDDRPRRLHCALSDAQGRIAWSADEGWSGTGSMRVAGWARPGRYNVHATLDRSQAEALLEIGTDAATPPCALLALAER